MSDDLQQVAHRVHRNVPLASINLLGSIKAVFAADFGRFDTLAVNDGQTRLGVPSCRLPHPLSQGRIDRFPGAIPTPFPKMVVHTVEVGVLMRQVSPLTARAQHVQDGIDHLAPIQCHRSPRSLPGFHHQRFEHSPLFICHITWITCRFVRHLAWLLVGCIGRCVTSNSIQQGLLISRISKYALRAVPMGELLFTS